MVIENSLSDCVVFYKRQDTRGNNIFFVKKF